MNEKEKILLRAMAKNQFTIMNMFEQLFSLLWETEDAALQLLNEDGIAMQDVTAQAGSSGENVETVTTKSETKAAEVMENEAMAPPKNKDKMSRTCKICEKEFEAKHNQRYCSLECAHKAKMKTQNERRAEAKAAEAKLIEDLTAPLTEHKERLSVAECQRIDAQHGVSYGVGELMGLHVKK